MTWANLKYRLRAHLKRWLTRTFAPPRYFVATYGGLGIDIEFFRDRAAYETASEQAEEMHLLGHIDTYIDGDIVP